MRWLLIDGSHKHNLQSAIDVIPKIQPDVVGLQQVGSKGGFAAGSESTHGANRMD